MLFSFVPHVFLEIREENDIGLQALYSSDKDSLSSPEKLGVFTASHVNHLEVPSQTITPWWFLSAQTGK